MIKLRLKWARHVTRTEKTDMHTWFWCANLKRPLGRSRGRWEEHIEIDLKSARMTWIGMVWFRVETSGGL